MKTYLRVSGTLSGEAPIRNLVSIQQMHQYKLSAKSYAVEIDSKKHMPDYIPGNILIVDPEAPVTPGDRCLFSLDSEFFHPVYVIHYDGNWIHFEVLGKKIRQTSAASDVLVLDKIVTIIRKPVLQAV